MENGPLHAGDEEDTKPFPAQRSSVRAATGISPGAVLLLLTLTHVLVGVFGFVLAHLAWRW